MQKSVKKRIKVSKNGKLRRRKMGQGHFRAKKSGKQTRGKRRGLSLSSVDAKVFKKYLKKK
ncbi:50S ribosomal protein L35 [Candidatus Wolfebacteria bacterium]|nr:50S ribosomal protein L35 [Candidatus Wolfebacteria bacterium]